MDFIVFAQFANKLKNFENSRFKLTSSSNRKNVKKSKCESQRTTIPRKIAVTNYKTLVKLARKGTPVSTETITLMTYCSDFRNKRLFFFQTKLNFLTSLF